MRDSRIFAAIETHALAAPAAPAVIVPGKPALTYAQLAALVNRNSRVLASLGFGRNERIAVVMPNGQEMAVAFFTVSNLATFVPLDPAYSKEQFIYYFRLLRVKALMVLQGSVSPALEAAAEMDLDLITVSPCSGDAPESMRMTCAQRPNQSVEATPGRGEDIAVILYTSGTTAKPKVILRCHDNMCMAANVTISGFRYQPGERFLLVTPLFRGISLSQMFAVLSAGGCAVCSDIKELASFVPLLREYQPSSFMAGPAVLQSIVEHIEKNGIAVGPSSLRFLRSTGAPLSEQLSARLQQIFQAPVVVSYGMTETRMLANNYLATHGHREGSVGVAVGCEIAVMDMDGSLLPARALGEIVVRGENILNGFEDGQELLEKSMTNGWFRTGDQGYLDEDGYIYITGRIKELINRGGEKVSPYEVEAALRLHPAVADGVVFPIPKGKYGEDIGAMLVLHPEQSLSLKQLRRYLKGKVAPFKMPGKLYLVRQIPTSQAGKVQRNTLHKLLPELEILNPETGTADEPVVAPRTEDEAQLAAIWREILNLRQLSIDDDFFEMGGDSLAVTELFAAIEDTWGKKIPLAVIVANSTVASLASQIASGQWQENQWKFLVPVKVSGDLPPLFLVHAADGEATSYIRMGEYLDTDQPAYALRFVKEGTDWQQPFNLADIAGRYLEEIRSVQPEGPYHLAGSCVGGVIAFEIARLLQARDQNIGLLVLFDGIIASQNGTQDVLISNLREMAETPLAEIPAKVCSKISKRLKYYRRKFLVQAYRRGADGQKAKIARLMDKEAVIRCARGFYQPKKYAGEITYFLPEECSRSALASIKAWEALSAGVRVINAPGRHNSVLQEKNIPFLAERIMEILRDNRGLNQIINRGKE